MQDKRTTVKHRSVADAATLMVAYEMGDSFRTHRNLVVHLRKGRGA